MFAPVVMRFRSFDLDLGDQVEWTSDVDGALGTGTSLSAVLTEGTEEFFGERLDKAKQVIAAGQSLQRNLDTDDLVGTVRYLLSDDSKFVTGQTIMVDGGTVFL